MLQPAINTKALHSFLLILISLCLLSVCDAAPKVCSEEEAVRAEDDIDNLKDWDSVYRSYRSFAHCDDGAIWEKYSDAVGNLLASDWKSLYKLNKLCSADKGFKSFVVKHLDILIPADTWEVIIRNATNKCPNGMRGLCKAILKRNDAVIRDIDQDKKQGKHLCLPPKPLPEGADDLRMAEGDFTFSKANESLRWLEKDLWDVIRQHKTTEELMRSTERFGIPFSNSVSRTKGVLLRQQALLEQEKYEIARLRLKTGSGSKADVEAAHKRFEDARREFCKFLEKAEWVD